MSNDVDLKAVELFLKTAKKEVLKSNRYFVLNRIVSYDRKKVSARNALYDLGITNVNEI